jgi:hypothetical protein
MDILAVGVLVIFFTIILGLLLSRGNVEAVRANWAERRCEPGVMFAGFMYKPADNPTSTSQFAIDNFQFCMKSLAQSVIDELMMPVFSLFKGVTDGAKSAGSSLNGVRTMMANITGGFSGVLDGFMEVYNRTMMQTIRVSSQLKMAYNRMLGIVLSSFYAGLSSLFAGLNMFSFVVKVIMIIMGIMLALIVILIFVLFPFMPIIMSVIAVLISVMAVFAGVIGSEINGMAGGFCFAGGTFVQMFDGSVKSISEVKLGDILYGNSVVKGTLKFSGKNVELFNYRGIKVSGEHLVYDEGNKKWMKVMDTNSLSDSCEEFIYSLVTSNNKIPVINAKYEQIVFADWEEFSDDAVTREWHHLVQDALHIPGKLRRGLSGSAHLNDNVRVKIGEELIRIASIKIGDEINDVDEKGTLCKTTVIGIYETNDDNKHLVSEGVWRYSSNYWHQGYISGFRGLASSNGKRYHLITTTGTYVINLGSSEFEFTIRDFTEMGVPNLKKVSSIVVDLLNKNNGCYRIE